MNNSTASPLDNLNREPSCLKLVSTVFIVVLSIISFSAIVGNILIMASFLKTPNLRTSTNYYIINMAVSDVLCACFNWPLYATEGMLTSNVFITRPLATVLCKLGMYFRGISQVVSVLSLVLIAVDRYIAIVYPLKISMLSSKRARLTLSLLTWVIPIASGFPYVVNTDIVKVDHHTFCRTTLNSPMNAIYNGAGFVVFYITPFITMVILYIRCVKELRKRPNNATQGLPDQVNDKRQEKNQKIVKMLIVIVTTFFICWTPLCAYLALKMFHPALVAKDKCMIFVALFFYVFPTLSGAVNPFILFLSSTNYRQALKSLCLNFCVNSHKIRSERYLTASSQIVETTELQQIPKRT